jgi:hypothetical protein
VLIEGPQGAQPIYHLAVDAMGVERTMCGKPIGWQWRPSAITYETWTMANDTAIRCEDCRTQQAPGVTARLPRATEHRG